MTLNRRKRVLLAENDPSVRLALEAAVAADDLEVVAVADGAEALARARQAPPDLLIAGVRLREIDGVELCRSLRAEPSGAETAILLLSGLSSAEDELRALAAGADRYLSKPTSVNVLRAHIRALLRWTEAESASSAVYA